MSRTTIYIYIKRKCQGHTREKYVQYEYVFFF